jgi:hypothetical protein
MIGTFGYRSVAGRFPSCAIWLYKARTRGNPIVVLAYRVVRSPSVYPAVDMLAVFKEMQRDLPRFRSLRAASGHSDDDNYLYEKMWVTAIALTENLAFVKRSVAVLARVDRSHWTHDRMVAAPRLTRRFLR